MKFNFEKHAPKEETAPQVEKTQEQFDAEIMQEADILGTNIENLTKEINAIGGIEKFQEIYSQKNGSFSRSGGEEFFSAETEGGSIVRNHAGWAKSENENSKGSAKVAVLIFALGSLMTAAGIHEGQGQTTVMVEAGAAGLGVLMTTIMAIKDKIRAKAYERTAKIMNLKMKMTDTPHKIIDKGI